MNKNAKNGRSLEQIEKMKKLYPTKEKLLAAGEYYLYQFGNSAIDPVNWPDEVLHRAVDVLEMVVSTYAEEIEELQSKPTRRGNDVEKISQVKNSYKRFLNELEEAQYLLGRSS